MSFIRFFVSSFDAADVIANMSMETINSKSGHVTANFSADNWKRPFIICIFWNRERISEGLT